LRNGSSEILHVTQGGDPGQGPPDLVVTPGSFTHVDTMWEDPAAALMYRRLASFSRLIRFDRVARAPPTLRRWIACRPWESYAEEVAAVLDEVSSERAAILVSLDAGSMAMCFAATKPERASALMFNTTATGSRRRMWRPGMRMIPCP
jgi:pimeloyl-ACP methyl ester carboxylesterase